MPIAMVISATETAIASVFTPAAKRKPRSILPRSVGCALSGNSMSPHQAHRTPACGVKKDRDAGNKKDSFRLLRFALLPVAAPERNEPQKLSDADPRNNV